MSIVAFFNASGGVGQTSLVYHLAWMYESLQLPVVIADLDPQANLTSRFFNTAQLDALWSGGEGSYNTIYGAIDGLVGRPAYYPHKGPSLPHWEEVSPGITVIAGDLSLARVEVTLSSLWDGRFPFRRAVFQFLIDFRAILQRSARKNGAELVLLDVGPNLTDLNRFALTISDRTVIPVGSGLRSLYGLRALGPTLWQWRKEFKGFLISNSEWDWARPLIPPDSFDIAGYVVQERAHYYDRPADRPELWRDRVQLEYESSILREPGVQTRSVGEPVPPLATIRYHTGLLPLAEDARKPMFRLTPADGVFDDQIKEVASAYEEFKDVAMRVAQACGVEIPKILPRN